MADATSRKRMTAVMAVLLAVAAGSAALYRFARNGPLTPTLSPHGGRGQGQRAAPLEDPRLTYNGPFLNVRPDVAYVGDQVCSQCHEDKARTYREHPMGRSLLPISRIAAQQRYDEKTHNPFEALGTIFLVERRGERLLHRQMGRDEKGQIVYEAETAVDYVLGSGTRGHSYLTDRAGYVFQTPISWYTQQQIWDKSPGFGIEMRPGRAISKECLFCHANRTRPREDYVNRYEEPIFDGFTIGCERCHGPGGEHVNNPGRKVDGVDYTIVNPFHLPPDLRVSVCEQCHLAGAARVLRRGRGLYDFRPGLYLESFWSVFVAADADGPREAVGHVEQMHLSKCFLRSKDVPPTKKGEKGRRKLDCTSCHDPHQRVQPQERVVYYRGKCLQCHEINACRVPEDTRMAGNGDSCIDCHLPRYVTSDIAHTASVNHRIIRPSGPPRPQPLSPEDGGEGRKKLPSPPGGGRGVGGEGATTKRPSRFVPFHPERYADDDKDLQRDLGVALVQIYSQGKADPRSFTDDVLSLLDAAVANDPDDGEAASARGLALTLLQRPADALAAYETLIATAPHREAALARAARLAQMVQKFDAALSYWRRAVAENPHEANYRAGLTRLLAHQKNWSEARPHCRAWLDLDPSNVDARVLWVSCLLHTGDKAGAQAEFERIKRLRPSNLPLLEARFAVELRSP